MRKCPCGEPITGHKTKVYCYKCADTKRLERKRALHAAKKVK
jgi:hypothetical protein